MKQILLLIFFLLSLAVCVDGQVSSKDIVTVTTDITGASTCAVGKIYYNATSLVNWERNNAGVCAKITSGGTPGNVVGPASATDLAIAIFDGTTGKLIKNSTALITTSPFLLKLGGTTSSFPALGGSGSELRFIKADNSNYSDARGSTLFAQSMFNAQSSANLFSTFSTDASGNTLFKSTEAAPAAATGALAGVAGNVDNGAHTIKVTCSTAAGESDPGVASNTVTVTNKAADGQISITSIPLCSALGTARKVYMTTVAAPTVYKLLSNGTISNNTATTLTANDSDATLGASTTAPSTNGAIDARLTVGQSLITATVPINVASITGGALPYDLAASYDGVPSASSTIRVVAPRAFSPASSWVGTICSAGTAATAQTDFLVKINGTTKATLRFAASGTTCSIVSPTNVSIVATDVITITAPGTPDATLADVAISIKGTLP